MDYGNNKITQHALKVSEASLTMLKLDTIKKKKKNQFRQGSSRRDQEILEEGGGAGPQLCPEEIVSGEVSWAEQVGRLLL